MTLPASVSQKQSKKGSSYPVMTTWYVRDALSFFEY
jgi:hypothetical protein